MLDRAYALLTVRTVDAARRTITGTASTPTPDRIGDVIDPLGATFSNPIPLLLHHDRERPVGAATLTATRDGIAFTATFPPDVQLPAGAVRDRVLEALHSVQAGLIRGVSVGFRPLEPKAKTIKSLPSGGSHFLKTEMCELSLVTIPANVDATIQTIKSFDTPFLTASGPHPPGVSGTTPRRPMQPTATEHIQNLENKRAATASRLAEILESAADDGATLTDEQATEHDGLAVQVKSLDADLQRWRELERMQVAKAIPILSTQTPRAVALTVPRSVTVRPNVPIGTSFVRAACALMVCQGNKHEAAEYAKRWDDSTPEVALYLKAAIAPGRRPTPHGRRHS